jgi:hypothetical protein
MAAHRLPDALFAALARPPAPRWLALRMRKPHADTGGHRTLRIATRATRRHAHESIQARDHAVAAINPATNLSLVPLKRWFGASRAQSMHTGTCSTLGRLAASQPAPTDALAGFSEHVSREHVTSAGPHRFAIERCFAACTATVSHAVGVELRLLSEAPGPARRDVDDVELTFMCLHRGSREKGGEVGLGSEVTEYPGPSGETGGGWDGCAGFGVRSPER